MIPVFLNYSGNRLPCAAEPNFYIRSTIITYLLFTCLIMGNYWENAYTISLNINDYVLVLGWFWGILGLLLFYKQYKINDLLIIKNISILIIIFLGVLISTICAVIYHDVPFFDELIAQRKLYNLLYFILFLYIKPSINEIKYTLRILSSITLILFCISIYDPSLFSPEEILLARNNPSDIGANVPGLIFVVLYLYIAISDLIKKKLSKIAIIEISIYIVLLILYQNRSILIGVLLVMLYALFVIRKQLSILSYFMLILMVILGLYSFQEIGSVLIDETISQLSTPSYNRWQAIDFFLFEYNIIPFCQIFGNGVPAAGTIYLSDLENASGVRWAFISDIGMLGMYFYYGIIPLIVIYYIIIKILIAKKYPYFIKFFSFHILIVPTIFEFAWMGAFYFSIYFYLFSYLSKYDENGKLHLIRKKRPIKI